MALTIKTNKYCYFCNDNLPVGAAIPLFTVTKNKEFTGKICFTSDGIVLAELLKSVGLDISFDANTSSSPRAACKKCARKIVNCSTLFHELQYSPKIMHAQEVAQEVLAPQEHASGKKKLNCAFSARSSKRKEFKILSARRRKKLQVLPQTANNRKKFTLVEYM